MLTHGSMFTGIGLLDYGLHLAGLTDLRWCAERDEWRRESILAQRFPHAVRYDDVRRVGRDCEPVDLIAGGFPCKGASTLGRLEGFGHPETVLWREMARAIGELRPRYVLVENVAHLLALHGGAVWGEVLGELASLGYDTVWDCLPAAAVGAPHGRDRVFAIATDTRCERRQQDTGSAHGYEAASAGWRTDEDHELGRVGSGGVSSAGEVAADARDGRREEQSQRDCQRRSGVDGAHRDDTQRRGPCVEWGEYEPAVRRWEKALGRPAPEPLLRGMDARVSRRVERSRLSALGDGVQCQVGQLAGAYILDLERSRVNP